jgi:hypothetical protein
MRVVTLRHAGAGNTLHGARIVFEDGNAAEMPRPSARREQSRHTGALHDCMALDCMRHSYFG